MSLSIHSVQSRIYKIIVVGGEEKEKEKSWITTRLNCQSETGYFSHHAAEGFPFALPSPSNADTNALSLQYYVATEDEGSVSQPDVGINLGLT